MRLLAALIAGSWFIALAQSPELDERAIADAVAAELRATNTPGAEIGIVREHKLVFAKGYGVSNIETAAPVAPDMVFRLGSTTKMMTAAAVAALAARGRLSFEDTAGKHIPGLAPEIAALTINQLLSHTSGLKDAAVMNGRHDDAALGEEIRRWTSLWLFSKPGRIYSYANPGYWLAGYLAEVVYGKPYADAMDELVFGPLEMRSTTLRPTMAMTRPLAQGHDLVDAKVSIVRPAPDNAANWPAGSIFSNVHDLARLAIALMNDGRFDGKQVLPPKAVAALTTPHAEIPASKSTYGYGITLQTIDGVRLWEHGGARSGYGSDITMLPDRQIAVIVLCNRTGQSLPKSREKIMAMFGVPREHTDDDALEASIPASELNRYVGTYSNGDRQMRVEVRDGKLHLGEAELFRRADGWLIGKTPDRKVSGRFFPVPGANGRVEFLYSGGRAAARI